MKASLCDTKSFIERARGLYGDHYDYSETYYIKSSEKVTIICPIHGKFEKTPNHHLRGSECNTCKKEKHRLERVEKRTAKFVRKAMEKHGDLYDYSQSRCTLVTEKVKIVCREHGPFTQTACSHTAGRGCPTCSSQRNAESRRFTLGEFLSKCREVHRDFYDYTEVREYINKYQDIIVGCPIHGNFTTTARSHIWGTGCQACGYLVVSDARSGSTEEFIRRSLEKHGPLYDYSKSVYCGSTTDVVITCKKHGDFFQNPCRHYNGQGCPECSLEYQREHFWYAPVYMSMTETSHIYIFLLETGQDCVFLKVGLSLDPEKRLRSIARSASATRSEIVAVFRGIGNELRLLELATLRDFYNQKFEPSVKFDGCTECLNYEASGEILKYLGESSYKLERII